MLRSRALLLQVDYAEFSKVLTDRLNDIVTPLIGPRARRTEAPRKKMAGVAPRPKPHGHSSKKLRKLQA